MLARPIEREDAQNGDASRPPVLEYDAVTTEPFTVRRLLMWWTGLICFMSMALAGLAAIWYGVGGMIYAATDAPKADRGGDYFSAGILSLIGALLLLYSIKWTHSLSKGKTRKGDLR
jgi:hypothetical protein